MRRAATVLLTLIACDSTALGTLESAPRLRTDLQPYGITFEPAPTHVATLAYQSPARDCAQVYRITVSYEPALALEEPSTSWLAVGHHPEDKNVQPPTGHPIPPGETFSGRLHYEGLRVQDPGVSRDAWISALHAGPTSPTAGCLGQSWDPIEDAFTLGWPKLTGRLTAVDERWVGLRVEGKCNKSACVDPTTFRGGADNPRRACVTDSLRNELAGVFDVGDERWALISSTWTDGHGPPDIGNATGIWSERAALISIEHGRPAWARAVIHYNFPQQLAEGGWGPTMRTWVMESLDACPGSLAAMGWARSGEDVAGAEDSATALANSEELRHSRRSSQRSLEPSE